MAYTSATAVQSEFKSITFSTSTAVTTADVTEFIAQEEAALDVEAGTVYTTPITGTNALAVMKLMATLMVKARVLDILPVKVGSDGAEQDSGSKALRDRVSAMIERIKSKSILLADATLLQSSGGVRSYANDNALTQVFKRETQSW